MVALTAIEFFSGIGAFGRSAARHGVKVIAAYDQSQVANHVYASNHGLLPLARNLDTIKAAELPAADLWWLSPPCKPYTVRGKRLDDQDSRARSLRNLMDLLSVKRPQIVMLENVAAFKQSNMHCRLLEQLAQSRFHVQELELCPTMFGIPMRRPRLFIVAVRDDAQGSFQPEPRGDAARTAIGDYLDTSPDPALTLANATLQRYMQGFDIIDALDKHGTAICFTSGYARCMRASGSLLRLPDGTIRRFSPEEMLRLFGFAEDFSLPEGINLNNAFKLIGNSVDVRAIDYLLSGLVPSMVPVVPVLPAAPLTAGT